jgi:hypothetical protein
MKKNLNKKELEKEFNNLLTNCCTNNFYNSIKLLLEEYDFNENHLIKNYKILKKKGNEKSMKLIKKYIDIKGKIKFIKPITYVGGGIKSRNLFIVSNHINVYTIGSLFKWQEKLEYLRYGGNNYTNITKHIELFSQELTKLKFDMDFEIEKIISSKYYIVFLTKNKECFLLKHLTHKGYDKNFNIEISQNPYLIIPMKYEKIGQDIKDIAIYEPYVFMLKKNSIEIVDINYEKEETLKIDNISSKDELDFFSVNKFNLIYADIEKNLYQLNLHYITKRDRDIEKINLYDKKFIKIDCTEYATFFLEANILYFKGKFLYKDHYQNKFYDHGDNLIQLSFKSEKVDNFFCGSNHVIIITVDKKDKKNVWVFGDNSRCQLALPRNIAFVKKPYKYDKLKKMEKFVLCDTSTFGITENNEIFGWGENHFGMFENNIRNDVKIKDYAQNKTKFIRIKDLPENSSNELTSLKITEKI